MTRAITLLGLMLSTAAAAQQNNWSIDRVSGTAVMDVVSTLTFRVTNAAGSRDPIQSFSIGIPSAPYDIDGATAPPGWRASSVDRRNRRVTFRAIDTCVVAGVGIKPGQSALFDVRVVGVPVSRDATNQDVTNNRTDVLDPCNKNVSFRTRTGNATWTLVGLDARAATSPRALDLNDLLTFTLTITNTSSVTQNTIAPAAPTITGTATFALVSGPTPASVTNLAQDASAAFSWTYRATARGTARFSSRASNTQVSSPSPVSADVNVGIFPAALITSPSVTVNNGVVTLQVLPTNNDTATITAVTPLAPVVTTTGTAAAVMLSGPTPTSVDSLSSRSTTAFTTTWRITGDPGDKVTFQARATAVNSAGVTITSTPVSSNDVTLQEVTVTPSPSSVLSGSTAKQISYTIANGSDLPISSVVLMTPDANLFRTPTAVSLPTGWTSTTSSSPRGIRFNATAAAQIPVGGTQGFTINYTSIGTVTVNTPTSHKAHVIFSDGTTLRTEGTVTVVVNRAVPDLIIPVAVATPGRAHFTWSNPAMHDGVLILRSSGAAPNTAPVPGTRYPAGTVLGNATVVYEDSVSFNTTFADTGLVNGTSYFYRLYNRDEYGLYSPANVPASSPNNYLLVVPPATTASSALWCSTVGLPALQQPYTDLGKAIYQSSNGSFFTGNVITVGAPINGNEKWRPSMTRGVVQARPTAQKLNGATEPSIFVGDQSGFAYRIDGATGAITWTGNGGVALGEVIQAQAVVAVRAFSNTLFQQKYPTDLVFFGTRNSTNRASNSLRALRADTGAQVFSYQPGNLDQITGAPLIDLQTNTLWIASLRTSGPSLRVIDVLNPAAAPLLTVSDLADIPSGVTRNGTTNQALVVDRTGLVRGYNLLTRAQVWQVNIGAAVTAPLVTSLNDFFVSTATGVQRYHVDPATNAVTTVWAAPTAMRLPSSVRVDPTNGKVFVGDGDGFLRRLNLATGALESSVKVSTTGAVSMPSLDTTPGLVRIYVGTADGRLCAYPTTF
jgi:hypothetical protein